MTSKNYSDILLLILVILLKTRWSMTVYKQLYPHLNQSSLDFIFLALFKIYISMTLCISIVLEVLFEDLPCYAPV